MLNTSSKAKSTCRGGGHRRVVGLRCARAVSSSAHLYVAGIQEMGNTE